MATTAEQQRLVEQHLGLVRAQASDVMRSCGLPTSIEFDDLVGFGTRGLIEAAQRFQPDRGAAFATFAYYRVRGAIYDGLRSFGWINRRDYARLRETERVDAYMQSHSDRDPGTGPRSLEDEVAALAEALGGAATVLLTSVAVEAETEVADERPGADDAIAADELCKAVRAALRHLPTQERAIVKAFYFKDRSLQDAGRSLGLSKSWTSRLHAAAIDKLRRRLAAAGPAGSPESRPATSGARAAAPPAAAAGPPAAAAGPPAAAAGPARADTRPKGRRR